MCTDIDECKEFLEKNNLVIYPDETFLTEKGLDLDEIIDRRIHLDRVLWLEQPDGKRELLYDYKKHPYTYTLEAEFQFEEEEGERELERYFTITVNFGKRTKQQLIAQVCTLFPEAIVVKPIEMWRFDAFWNAKLKHYDSKIEELEVLENHGSYKIVRHIFSRICYRLNDAWWINRKLKDLEEFLQEYGSVWRYFPQIILRLNEVQFNLELYHNEERKENTMTITELGINHKDPLLKTREFNEKIMTKLWEWPYTTNVCRKVESRYIEEPEVDTYETTVCTR